MKWILIAGAAALVGCSPSFDLAGCMAQRPDAAYQDYCYAQERHAEIEQQQNAAALLAIAGGMNAVAGGMNAYTAARYGSPQIYVIDRY